eukprot:10116119-Ditylum_brightwellii.AAC.1
MIPLAVELSVMMGVSSCGWPISINVKYISYPFLVLSNSPPISACVADAINVNNALHTLWIGPLMGMGPLGELLGSSYAALE